MERKLRLFVIAALLLTPAAAAAQAPPDAKPPFAPGKEMRDPDACVEAPATVGKGGGLDLKKRVGMSVIARIHASGRAWACPSRPFPATACANSDF